MAHILHIPGASDYVIFYPYFGTSHWVDIMVEIAPAEQINQVSHSTLSRNCSRVVVALWELPRDGVLRSRE